MLQRVAEHGAVEHCVAPSKTQTAGLGVLCLERHGSSAERLRARRGRALQGVAGRRPVINVESRILFPEWHFRTASFSAALQGKVLQGIAQRFPVQSAELRVPFLQWRYGAWRGEVLQGIARRPPSTDRASAVIASLERYDVVARLGGYRAF